MAEAEKTDFPDWFEAQEKKKRGCKLCQTDAVRHVQEPNHTI
jgi:hypothetical protein